MGAAKMGAAEMGAAEMDATEMDATHPNSPEFGRVAPDLPQALSD